MTSRNKLLALAHIVALPLLGCTAGGEVIPDASGSGGSGGSVMTTTSGGTGTGVGGATGGSGPSAGGSAGSIAIGGTGGTSTTGVGGSVATGGTGGATGGDPYEAVKMFDGWRVDMECTVDPGKTFLSDNCTQGGDICWMADDSTGRTMFTRNLKVGGDAANVYKFRVRIRGVLEPKEHANCAPLFQGDNVPMRVCKCNDANCLPVESGFNWMRLNIASPPQRYWLNNALDSVSHRVEVIDGQFELEARGQTDVEFFFDNLNTGQIRNCSNKLAPDLPFENGNFFILDIIPGSVTSVPTPL